MAGKYTEFEKQANGNLHIVLLPEAREDVQEIASQEIDADSRLSEVIEWQLANGWSLVQPKTLARSPMHRSFPRRWRLTSRERYAASVPSTGILSMTCAIRWHNCSRMGMLSLFAQSKRRRKIMPIDPDISPADRGYALHLL